MSIVSLSATGSEIIETSTDVWELTPAKDFSGDIKVSFVISDGNNGYALGESNLKLLAVNDLPVKLAGTVSDLMVLEDSPTKSLGLAGLLYGPGGGNDELTQQLTYTVSTLPDATIGVVSLSDGTAVTANTSYTLNELRAMQFSTVPDGFGDTSFSFKVSDDAGAEITETINIAVEGVNDKPERSSEPLASLAVGTEDTAYTLNQSELLVGFTDRDGDTLSVINLDASNGSLVDNENGTWTFTPDANFNGQVEISYHCLLYTSPSPRDATLSRMPSSA